MLSGSSRPLRRWPQPAPGGLYSGSFGNSFPRGGTPSPVSTLIPRVLKSPWEETHEMTSFALPALPPVSSLESYIHAVNAVPMLSVETEVELGRRLRQQNDLAAASQLVLSHLRLVVSVARNYMGYGLPQADLVQEGNIGLMKAVKRFDPERGVRLASFAIHWIKAEIHEFILRNCRMVKIATTKAHRKLFFNLRSMKSSTAALTPGEITQVAKTLNVKESDVIEMEQR